MKKLSARGLVDYLVSSPARQRTLLRHFKYPEEDEARARITYYREALDRIHIHHANQHEPAWLRDQADYLDSLARQADGNRRARLRYNAAGLRSYAEHFGRRVFTPLSGSRMSLQYGDVRVTVSPDLSVTEKDKPKIIRLHFLKDSPSEMEILLYSQLFLEAVQQRGLPITSSGVLFFDVHQGVEHRCARVRTRLANDIEAACMAISAIWDTI